MRWTSLLLAALLLTLFLPASAAKPDIIVDDGTCFGVNPGNADPPIFADRFTGYCWTAWPCICPEGCQHWYVHGIYVFQIC